MEKTIFVLPAVGDVYNENFISVKLDAEKGWGKLFAQNNKVTAYPTYLYFSNKGDVLLVTVGAMSADQFISIGKTAMKNFQEGITLASVNKQNAGNMADVTPLLANIKKISPLGRPNAMLVEAYLKTIPKDSLYVPSTVVLVSIGYDGTMSTKSLAYQVLMHAYNEYPVKSKELMSPWNTLSNKLKAGIDSAGKVKDLGRLKELLSAYDQMENIPTIIQRENKYLLCRYDIASGSYSNFIIDFKKFANDNVLNIDTSNLYTIDRSLFAKAQEIKFKQKKFSDLTPQQFRMGFSTESERTFGEINELISIYKRNFPNRKKSKSLPVDLWAAKFDSIYNHNPIYAASK